MTHNTLPGLLTHWASERPDTVWMRDLKEEGSDDYTWAEASTQINAVAAMLESRFGQGEKMVVLSRNCAHWVMADMAIITSGNVQVSMFTTLPGNTAEYIFNLTETKVVLIHWSNKGSRRMF